MASDRENFYYMKKSITTDLTPANIASVLEILAASPSKLEVLTKSLPKAKWNQPLGKDERTPVEVLAHMLNSEARSAEMIYQALLVDEPYFVTVHSERELGKLLHFDLLEFTELLAYFQIRRKVLLRVLSNLRENDWGRTLREEGKQRKESVYWRARTIAMHEQEHLEDLEKKLLI